MTVASVAKGSAKSLILQNGGEGGIRTPDTVARMPHFECGAFDHSATSPNLRRLERRGAVFSGDGGETQGRDVAARRQSSRPSLRSSE